MRNAKGFTMVELLVVLVIVAILAAVATPLFIQNTKRAKASEAIATIGLIRQALRDYKINANKYFNIRLSQDNIKNPIPPTTAVGSDGNLTGTYGLDIDVGTSQYFSNGAFSVKLKADLGSSDFPSEVFGTPAPVDFIITATGDTAGSNKGNVQCTTGGVTDCAVKADEVKDYIIKMDNSGRIAISYKDGSNESDKIRKWSNY